jgi:redox-sensing transcriptional repressor
MIVAGKPMVVRHITELHEAMHDTPATIGVIATPESAAQDVCDLLIKHGVTSILNFAPVLLDVPAGIDVRRVDLATELQILAFHEQRKLQLTLSETNVG